MVVLVLTEIDVGIARTRYYKQSIVFADGTVSMTNQLGDLFIERGVRKCVITTSFVIQE